MKILVLNAGSSSQKSSLYDLADSLPERPPEPVWEVRMEYGVSDPSDQETGESSAHLTRVRTKARGRTRESLIDVGSRREATEHMLGSLWKGATAVVSGPEEINVVGHRVVHGGSEYSEPTRVTAEVKAAIKRLAVFAPLHNQAELEGIEVVEQTLGAVTQVVAFDTAFHARLPKPAAVYPGPYRWLELGIRRYGFHGINHQYCAGRAAQLLGKDLDSLRLITCHLGNGCSLAAIRNGRSVDTTMGFTPLDGLMMGTRSGSVDPGILTFLMRTAGRSGPRLDEVLNHESGLLGISGVSSDMRQILAAMKSGNERARLAFEMFVHRLRRNIGAMLTSLSGLDALVFTAGIGENTPEVRAAAVEGLGFLGLALDAEKNQQSHGDEDIAAGDSAVRILVIRAQEDWAIAHECWRVLNKESGVRSQESK